MKLRGIPIDVIDEGKKLRLKFGYNKTLLGHVKDFQGAQWQPERRSWVINNNVRNWFQIRFLSGENVYERYDRPLIEVTPNRPNLYKHQLRLLQHGLTRHYGIWGADPGVGKTLAAIELMEHSGFTDWLYVAPKSALNAVILEFQRWNCLIRPRMMTYDGLRTTIGRWKGQAPKGVIFDESSRLKNPQSQRSQAAMHLADAIREEWGDDGFVILMSGSPAPRDPTDWWNQTETAVPGWCKQGDINKFKRKLALVVQKENTFTGGTFPALVTWFDDEKKCKHCGMMADDIKHDSMQAVLNDYNDYHKWEPSVNEVALLHKKLQGLVEIVDKKQALDLPDRIYKTIKLEPDKSTLRAANLIVKRAKSAAVGLILLRELSDGFQYTETEIGEVRCEKCGGRGEYEQIFYSDSDVGISNVEFDIKTEMRLLPCPLCDGKGMVAQFERNAIQVPCPKEQAFIDCLDDHEDIGRLVAYGGFTGTVDRMVSIARKHQWDVLRIDGRGWLGIGEKIGGSAVEMLRLFQSKTHNHKTIVIAQAGAGGMGLTLTASPTIFYYSNSFDSEARDQSEQRIHRPGMDYNLGATIIDCMHLPSDERILTNLKKKVKLQSMTLGRFVEEFAIDE